MASKLNTSLPKKRALFPPELLRERHDSLRKTRNTMERQRLDASPMVKNFTNFRFTPDANPIPDTLFGPGRGKAAGSKRILKVPKPPLE